MLKSDVFWVSVDSDIKPKETYAAIIVLCSGVLSDIGFYDGHSVKFMWRNKYKHSDITHWAYLPKKPS